MKLLLTSGGISNDLITDALRDMIGKNFSEATLAFIPTAANVEKGDKRWLIKDLVKCKDLGFREVDIVDISALSQDEWLPRLKVADVIMFGGGNTSYLMSWLKKSGLNKILPKLLTTKVYVGVSAGSMVVAPNLREKEMQKIYNEPIVDDESNEGLGLVDFLVVPHINSPYFPRALEFVEELAKNIIVPMYAIDDETAIAIWGEKTEIISRGFWKKFN
jgi:dipeptidase E